MAVNRLGIFADDPRISTEFSIVCSNITKELISIVDSRVIYFGRFGNLPAGQRMAEVNLYENYEYVACEGGNWKADLVKSAIKKYKLDTIFSEDIWTNVNGLVKATQQYKIPFHFLTPIDNLPIHKNTHQIFEKCAKVYVPNASYNTIKNGYYLPYGVDFSVFKPFSDKKFNKFTFLWSGRDEEKKNLGRAFLAFEKIYDEIDSQMIIRTNWTNEQRIKKADYFKRRKIPIILDKINHPYYVMSSVYNACHVYLCTSKMSAWEMEITEALSCGLPILCTDAPYMNQHIINEKNGFLIPVEDGNISEEKLAEKMIWCYKNPKNILSMGLWGAGDIRDKYSWKKTAKDLCDWMDIE